MYPEIRQAETVRGRRELVEPIRLVVHVHKVLVGDGERVSVLTPGGRLSHARGREHRGAALPVRLELPAHERVQLNHAQRVAVAEHPRAHDEARARELHAAW